MRRVNCNNCHQSFLTAQTGDECPLCKKPDGLRQISHQNRSGTSDNAGDAQADDAQAGDGVGGQAVSHPAAAPLISISDIIRQQAPPYKLFSSASVVLASLFTVVGGAVVMAINCNRLSRPIRGVVILIVLGAPAVLVDIYLIHWTTSLRAPNAGGAQAVFVDVYMSRDADGRPMPFSALWIFRALVMLLVAYSVQGRAVIDHELSGGKLDSWWKALGIGWLMLFLIGVIAEVAFGE